MRNPPHAGGRSRFHSANGFSCRSPLSFRPRRFRKIDRNTQGQGLECTPRMRQETIYCPQITDNCNCNCPQITHVFIRKLDNKHPFHGAARPPPEGVAAEGEAYADALALAREFAVEVDPGAAAMAKRLITSGWAAPTATGRYMEYLAEISQLASDALASEVDKFTRKE